MTAPTPPSDHGPFPQALDVLGDRWTLLLIHDILHGAQRFDALQKRHGISSSLLTRRLRHLVDQGLLTRDPLPGARRHTYAPTPKCEALRPILRAIAVWAENWSDPAAFRAALTQPAAGQPVAPAHPPVRRPRTPRR